MSSSVQQTTARSAAASTDAVTATRIRRIILEQSKRAHVGHIGSALSIADIIAAMYGGMVDVDDPDSPDRDRVVLSKGHAVLALYAAMHLRGWLTEEDLDTYCGDDTVLGSHPEHVLRGIDFCTGSLGMGLSMASGAALAARMSGSGRRVFCLSSDAECNEGSLWEATMFAAHHGLANLVMLIDANGQQALGYTRDVLDTEPLPARFEAFGWDVHEVDGHDVDALRSTVAGLDTTTGKPHVLVCRTTFGKGVSYMENLIRWHYMPMDDDQYAQALAEVGEAGA